MAKDSNQQQSLGSDEVDIFKLFQWIRNGFNRLFNGLLRLFIYLKGKLLILVSLLIIGLLIGFGLKSLVTKRQKIELIVQPNLESQEYLYDVVNEIQANIDDSNTAFFESIGYQGALEDLEISINKIGQDEEISREETAYIEMLLNYENTALISDIIRAEILNNISLNHKITIYFKNSEAGSQFAETIMGYINQNTYYNQLVDVSNDNIQSRIEQNGALIEQIDKIILGYAENLSNSGGVIQQGQILLDNEKPLDITGLISIKNNLIRDTELKKIELIEQDQLVRVIHFGKPQRVKTVIFAKYHIMVPLLLIGLFFLLEFLRYLDRKSKEILV